jgi:cupin superfamily protein
VTTRLDVEPGVLADAVRCWRPAPIRHRVSGHPLLDVDVVARLADELPARDVVHHLGDVPLLLPRGDAPALDLGAGDVASGIRDNRCWVRIGNLQRLPGWDVLLDECLAGVGPRSVARAQVFLGSPGAVTPAHMDLYHNLLLQVQGTKEFSIGRFPDPRDADREIARHFDRERENFRILPPDVSVYRLEPGDGLYIPPYTPHWAQGGDEVSLALSCNFSDAASDQAELVQVCNARLRRLGLKPAPPRRSPLRDRMKAGLVRTWRASRRRR